MCIRDSLLTALEKELTRRRFGPPVRLEVQEDIEDHVLELITRELGISRAEVYACLLYTSPSPRDRTRSRMPSSA